MACRTSGEAAARNGSLVAVELVSKPDTKGRFRIEKWNRAIEHGFFILEIGYDLYVPIRALRSPQNRQAVWDTQDSFKLHKPIGNAGWVYLSKALMEFFGRDT